MNSWKYNVSQITFNPKAIYCLILLFTSQLLLLAVYLTVFFYQSPNRADDVQGRDWGQGNGDGESISKALPSVWMNNEIKTLKSNLFSIVTQKHDKKYIRYKSYYLFFSSQDSVLVFSLYTCRYARSIGIVWSIEVNVFMYNAPSPCPFQ